MYIPWTFNKFWSNHYNNDWIRSHPKSFSSSRFTGDVAAIVERCILCFEVRWFRGLLGQPCGRRWLYLWLLTGCLKVQLYTQVYMTFRRHRHYLHIHHMFSTLLVELVDIILICIYMYGILIARGNPVWLTAMLNIHIYIYIHTYKFQSLWLSPPASPWRCVVSSSTIYIKNTATYSPNTGTTEFSTQLKKLCKG